MALGSAHRAVWNDFFSTDILQPGCPSFPPSCTWFVGEESYTMFFPLESCNGEKFGIILRSAYLRHIFQ